MNALVADTHAAVWYDAGDLNLSAALAAMDDAIQGGRRIVIASISLVEVAYLERRGRVPAGTYADLGTALDDPEFGLVLAPWERSICDALRNVPPEQVPDMPDRIIAATALHLGLPLISRDRKIQASAIQTIW